MTVEPHAIDRSIASASPFRVSELDSPPARQWDREAHDADELEPTKSRLGGRISKKDARKYGGPWRRLRKVDSGAKSWDPDDSFDRRQWLDADSTTTRDNRHGRMLKVHRVSTAADEIGVDGATENRARLLVAGVDAGPGHPVEKVVGGALVVARDRHVAERLAALNVDEPLGEQLDGLTDLAPGERFRALNALATVADCDAVQSVLSRRLTSLDSFTEWADAEGVAVADAVLNLPWEETVDDVRGR